MSKGRVTWMEPNTDGTAPVTFTREEAIKMALDTYEMKLTLANRELTRLEAENRKLRAALKTIRDECPHWDCCNASNSLTTAKWDYSKCDCHVFEARAALEGKSDED